MRRVFSVVTEGINSAAGQGRSNGGNWAERRAIAAAGGEPSPMVVVSPCPIKGGAGG